MRDLEIFPRTTEFEGIRYLKMLQQKVLALIDELFECWYFSVQWRTLFEELQCLAQFLDCIDVLLRRENRLRRVPARRKA